MSNREIIVMNPKDNVGVCLRDIRAGEKPDFEINGKSMRLTALNAIPIGHKLALAPIHKEDPIIKYGEIIGRAVQDISPGEHVHLHNVTDYE